MISELMYAGKSLREIAGYSDLQLRRIVFRERDKFGALVRVDDDLPEYVRNTMDENGHRVVKNPKPFAIMFKQVAKRKGMDDKTVAEQWESYVKDNPKLKKGGDGAVGKSPLRNKR